MKSRYKIILNIGVFGILLCSGPLRCIAADTAKQMPAHISIMSHSINSHGDAHSQIFHADFNLKSGIGFMAEMADITDAEGSVVINQVGVVRQLADVSVRGASLYAFAGITELSAESPDESRKQRAGLMLGLGADYVASSLISTYARVSVASLAKALWTIDAGVRYAIRPKWDLVVGYRGYEIAGSSLGGPTAGITYSFQQ